MTTPSDNTDPRRPSTANADSPPGGGRRPYAWVWGLLFVAVVIALAALLIT